MTERDICPLCDKPVAGPAALKAHLEFAHDVADPVAYLAALDRPQRWSPPWRLYGRRALAGLGVVVVLVGLWAGVVSLFSGSEDQPTLAADTGADEGAAPGVQAAAAAPATSGAPVTATPATAPPTTLPAPVPTTAPPTTVPRTTTRPEPQQASPTGPFRKPFVTGARVERCTAGSDVDTYEVVVTLSGARNIVFDGELFPGPSGDGDRVVVHERPAGTAGYLDHIDVADVAGNGYEVDVLPPLHLPGC